MYMSSVTFENHPDSLMNDWIISPEIVKIAIKQFFFAILSTFQIRSSSNLYSS